jgi:hypothetical protein
MKVKATKEEIEEWSNDIRRIVETLPRNELYTILKHCSKSGMKRVIQVVALTPDGPLYLGYRIAAILGMPYDEKREGVVIGGVGMDMGFAIVYELSAKLYRNPDGSYSHEGAYKIHQRWL